MSLVKHTILLVISFACSVGASQAQPKDRSDTLSEHLSGYRQWIGPKADTFTVKFVCSDTTVHAYTTNKVLRYVIYGWHKFSEKGDVLENSLGDGKVNCKSSTIIG